MSEKEVCYVDRLPENPPDDIIEWILNEGAFNDSNFIIFKQGWQSEKSTGKKKKAASCICTACGNAFFAKWISTESTKCNEYGIGIEKDSSEYKKLALVSSDKSTAFALHFDILQQSFNKMKELAAKLEQNGNIEQALKLKKALKKALLSLAENIEEV